MSQRESGRSGLTRREASGLIAAAAMLGAVPVLNAQPPRRGRVESPAGGSSGTPPKSFLTEALTRGRSRDWILKPTIHVSSYQEDPARTPKDRMPTIGNLSFKTAAVVFPVIRGCGSSETDVDNVVSELRFNDAPVDLKPDYNESYHASVRLGRWEMRDKTGRECDLKLEIPMTCWQTVFDEKVAAKAGWPDGGRWGRVGMTTLAPQAKVDQAADDARALRDLMKRWTNDKPPQSVSPLLLAKAFAARAIEEFQPSGNGERYSTLGTFVGLDLKGPAQTIRDKNGSPHDIASVLLGAYRAAGLPSRLVIGYDESDRKGDNSSPLGRNKKGGVALRSWVEFCLFDPETQTEAWIPVDVVRIRSRSSRVGRLEEPWKYFGTHDELDVILPFAHHFIPPTTVISYGYAFWGWLTMPESQIADHSVRFTAQTAPKRAQPRKPADKNKRPE